MLEVKNLTLHARNQPLIKSINFRLEPGKIYALAGRNGSGKSTLLKSLHGLWPLQEGNLLLNDLPLPSLSRSEWAQKTAYLPPYFNPRFPYTAGEIVRMGRFMHRESLEKSLPFVEKGMKLTETYSLRDHPFESLSSGEKQRVLIARLWVTGAQLWLLDEPTSMQDPWQEKKLWELFTQVKKTGKTLLIAIHHMEIAKKFIDEILFLHKGKLIPFCETSRLDSTSVPLRPDEMILDDILESLSFERV